MNKIILKNKTISGEAIFLQPSEPVRAVLFAAGSGGNPERHDNLLNSLMKSGCIVIAPYFERIVSPFPTAEQLELRVALLEAALDRVKDLNLPVVGIGHSIGATLLIGLAGGQMWMGPGRPMPIKCNEIINKLVLFTPPVGFFQAPNALTAIQVPIQVWAGSLDVITPSDQIEFLLQGLSRHVSVETHVVAGAGHFSFMNSLPPNIVDPMRNREEFLGKLSADVCRFVLS